RISVRRGSTIRSSCRRSNDDNRDQRIFPFVWSRVALGSVRDSNPWPSLAPEGPAGVLAVTMKGCTDPLIHKSAALSREGSLSRRGSHPQSLWGGQAAGGMFLDPAPNGTRVVASCAGPGVQGRRVYWLPETIFGPLETKGFGLIAKIMGA